MIELFHHRWALPLLAELRRSGGAKFVTLAYRLGASQGALRPALRHLAGLGLVERNPGYGHPLRPEYYASDAGLEVGRAAGTLLAGLEGLGATELGLRKWTMPVLHAIGGGELRFTEVRRRVPGISDRALSEALKRLGEAGLVERTVTGEFPPVSRYACAARGRPLLPRLDALARLTARPRAGGEGAEGGAEGGGGGRSGAGRSGPQT